MRASLLSVTLVTIVIVSSTLATSSLSIGSSIVVRSSLPLWFEHVVVIMMENHGINVTYGKACAGNCTFFNDHANTNGLAENYADGGVLGSLGDYIAITSGDGTVSCNGGPGSCGPFSDLNIVDTVEAAHLSWRAYAEDYPLSCGSNCSPGNCFTGSSSTTGHYAVNHNPFVYYTDILNNASRCSKIGPANSAIATQTSCGNASNPGTVETDDILLNDLNSVANAANYTFLTPNNIDNLHDCLTSDVSTGNRYLQQLVPQILNSAVFKTGRAALFVTFDEPDPFVGQCPNCFHLMYTVWASHNSALTKSALKSVLPYNHYSALKTIEDNWGLPSINSTDASANSMNEFFK